LIFDVVKGDRKDERNRDPKKRLSMEESTLYSIASSLESV